MDNMTSESALLQRLSEGDEEAFANVYHRYQPKLYLFVFPLSGFSEPDTHEIIQDIFVKLWLRRETLISVRSIQAYLFMMARNRLSDLRTEQSRQRLALDQLGQHQGTHHSEVQDNILFAEYHGIARKAIGLLSDRKRQIYGLHKEEGLSLDEIAARLNITKFAVKKQLYEAVQFIKKYLKDNAHWDIPIILLLIFLS
jgi:RNA polymerase sigma factor (sigma-70 family)